MIDVHFWPTPNGHKITVFLEEAGVRYRLVPVDIGRGAQFAPEFLAISPNNRMPAIVDHEPEGGGEPVAVFESAAILVYLADKTQKLCPRDVRGRKTVLEWLAWQVANVGPAMGQLGHFKNYADVKIPYAIERFENEVHRLYGVLDHRLEGREFVADAYSIADIALFPWIRLHDGYGLGVGEFPNVAAWIQRIAARPAVARGLEAGKELRDAPGLDAEAKKILFGQRARRR